MQITASMVKELRERTGSGMMECKKALQETDGDIDVAIENMRKSGDIGASLNAEVSLYCNDEIASVLHKLADELHFIFITSKTSVVALQEAGKEAITTELEGLKLTAIASTHEKCVRCWHHREDVGSHAEHPELCGRCVDNISGDGEVRLFA